MKWLTITVKDIKIILGDKLAWILMILLPLVVLTVAGLALSGMFRDKVPDMKLGYYYNGDTEAIHSVLHGYDNMSNVEVIEMKSKEEGIDKIKQSSLTALLVIPEDFSVSTMDTSCNIEFLYATDNQSSAGVLAGITKGIVEKLNSNKIAVSLLLEQRGQQKEQKESDDTYVNEILSKLHGDDRSNITITEEGIGGDLANKSFYQVIPGFAVMFLLFSILSGSNQIIEERQNKTLRRILVAPMNKWNLLFGKWAGVTIIGFFQAILLFFAGHFIFGFSLGDNIPRFLFFLLIISTAIGAIGICIASVARSFKQANGLSMLLFIGMSALGGSWWPLEITPVFMQNIGKVTFNYWAISGIKKIILYNATIVDLLPEISVIGLIFILFFGVSMRVFRYE